MARVIKRALSNILHELGSWRWEEASLDALPGTWDPTHWENVFIELTNNSRDFASPDRPLLVEVRAEAKGVGPDRRLCLIYTDNGRGVRPDLKGRIFETFESHREGIGKPGKGVGLSYVRRVVSAQAGIVREDGVFGEGARFVFDLPWPEPPSSVANKSL